MTGKQAAGGPRLSHQGWCLLLFAGIGLWNLPTLWYPFEPAHGLAQVIAKVILEGGVPYRDALDVKPPAVFYLQAALIAMAGDKMAWLRVADLVSLWLTMGSMVHVGSRVRSRAAGLWGALLLGLSYPLMGFWKTAQAESFLLPWLWWSLLLAIRGDRDGSRVKSLLCGASLGVVFWFKYPYAIPLVLLVVERALHSLKGKRADEESLWSAFPLAGGFLAVVGGGALHLWGIGALEELWRVTVAQNVGERLDLVAAGGTFLRRSAVYWASLAEFRLFVLVLALALVGSSILIREGSRVSRVVLGYFFCMFAAVELQMRLYHYHVVPLLSTACLLAGIGLDGLIRACFAVRVRAGRAMAALSLLVLVATALLNHHEAFRRWWAYAVKGLSWEAYLATFPDLSGRYRPFVLEEWQVGQTLRALLPPGESLFVWGGFVPLPYYFSGLRPSTPVLYTNLLTVPGPWGRVWMEKVKKTFSATPPGAVVVLTSGDLAETLRELQRSAPFLHELLHAHYSLEAKVGPFLIYKRLAERQDLHKPGGP
jgi:hypothetical protein